MITRIPFESLSFLRLITKTSKSQIWLAKLSDDLVIVKEIPLSYLSASPHRADHVWQERQVLDLLTEINYPKSPKLIGTSKTKQSLINVMELIFGAPMHLHMQSITLSCAKYFFSEIINIVQSLHSHRIVHKDIKLSNFILCENSARQLVICDFGLSFILTGSPTNVECSCGTLHSKAPEKIVSFAQDFFSLGIILYELLNPQFSSHNWTYKFCLESISHIPDATDLVSQLAHPDVSRRLCDFSSIRNHPFLRDTPMEPPQIDPSIAYQFIFGRSKNPLDDF